ncbi:MAG: hypothetical protein GY926_16875 [bacterium]|nr:hypothetical protein [bacterium]
MFRRKLLISALCIGLSACGAIDEPTVQEGGESAPAITTSTLVVPPEAPVDGTVVPVVEDPVAVALENPNDPSSPIGALCWAQAEITRVSLAQVLKPMVEQTGDSRAAELDTDIKAAFERATDPELREYVMAGGLPAEVHQFADAMFRMFDKAIAATADLEVVTTDDLETILDFESLPGADEFVKYASEAPECRNRLAPEADQER